MATLDDSACRLAAAGDLDGLAKRLRAEPDVVRRRNAGGETLLHIAARQWPKLENGADIARLLLQAGADVNAADNDGQCPLHGATGDLELTRVLLEAGARGDVYAADHMNMSPAEICLYYGLPAEAQLMVDHGAPTDLRIHAGLGDADTVRGYLDAAGRFRPDSIGLPGQPGPELSLPEGITQALSYAARNGHIDVADVLLDHGADIDALAPHMDVGCTPVHAAVSAGHFQMVEHLVERGARLDIRDDTHDSTALGWAVFKGDDKMAAFLKAHEGNA